jgi:hypothetical protein
MEPVTLERYADVPLHFTGELIADVTTHEDGIDQWEEIRVWRTDSDRTPWIVQWLTYDLDRVVDEPFTLHTWRCKHPLDVRSRLKRRDPRNRKRWYLTELSYDALEEAVENDERLNQLLVETVT